ncbi:MULTISPECIES: recombinase family protein [unclassified Pseudomonas]|uniref:recombinase family protein n=1 Tax=unclassified Pseudomonas TaxID=196821 RepID=UPI002005A553|nr:MULTISPECIES: recombinase family protein [unclassified Pseudomonas]MCK6187376.1 recombinase family protein [Pseudomonas sp. EYE_354]WLH66896.1 recombinase family protein [Pseudomonas sp. FP2309]
MLIGYARVSTEEQNLDLQTQALQKLGCDKIYSDFGVSGAKNSRQGLDQAMARLRSGDKLVVWRLDRLGRSLAHLVQLLEILGRRNIRFHSITEHIDTSSSGGRLVFHMMAALAEFERSLISERTRAGIAAARARGKPIGRPHLLSPEQVNRARSLIEKEHHTQREVAKLLRVHPRTLQRMLIREKAKGGVLNMRGELKLYKKQNLSAP